MRPYTSSIGPDALPALAWLLSNAHLSKTAVDELIDEGVGPHLDRHIILVTYDQLPPATRTAAQRISVLCDQQRLNDTRGPFNIKVVDIAVTKQQREALLSCGFLRQARANGPVHMPRIVLDIVLARAVIELDGMKITRSHGG